MSPAVLFQMFSDDWLATPASHDNEHISASRARDIVECLFYKEYRCLSPVRDQPQELRALLLLNDQMRTKRGRTGRRATGRKDSGYEKLSFVDVGILKVLDDSAHYESEVFTPRLIGNYPQSGFLPHRRRPGQ